MELENEYIPDEVDLELLELLEATPGELLQRHGAPEDTDGAAVLDNALSNSARAQNTEAATETTTETVTPPADGAPLPPPVSPTATPIGNMARYSNAMQPVNPERVKFKLAELFDPELAVMITDMLFSWGGEIVLDKAADIIVEREDIQADEFQKKTLVKAFTPAFQKYEVSTDNPLVAMFIGIAAVYGMNIGEVVRKDRKARKEAEENDREYNPTRKERTKARYSKSTAKPAAKKRDYKAENERRKTNANKGNNGSASMPPNPTHF